MRILVCGSRHWKDKEYIHSILSKYPEETVIIEGGCRGADSLACEVALHLKFDVMTFYADWKRLGRAAGPIRNQRMLKEGDPDIVIAFHRNVEDSKETKDMVKYAESKGIPVTIYTGLDTSC